MKDTTSPLQPDKERQERILDMVALQLAELFWRQHCDAKSKAKGKPQKFDSKPKNELT